MKTNLKQSQAELIKSNLFQKVPFSAYLVMYSVSYILAVYSKRIHNLFIP